MKERITGESHAAKIDGTMIESGSTVGECVCPAHKGAVRRTTPLCLGALAALMPWHHFAAAAENTGVIRLSGGDDVAWIVGNYPDPDDRNAAKIVEIRTARRSSPTPRAQPPLWTVLRPLQGDVRQAAANRDELILLFADNTICTVSAGGSVVTAPRLPSDIKIDAMAGDAADGGVYLLARLHEPFSSDSAASQPTTLAAGFRLLRLRDSKWLDLGPVPGVVEHAHKKWIAVREQRALIVFAAGDKASSGSSAGGDGVLHWIEHGPSGWTEPQRLAGTMTAVELWAGWPAHGPSILVGEGTDATHEQVRLLWRDAHGWVDGGLVQTENRAATFSRDGVDAAFAHGRIVMVRADDAYAAQVGWANITDKPGITWESGTLGGMPRWSQWASGALILVIVIVLTVLRPHRMASMTPLPAHITVALPWRRVMAGLIDLVPAMAATAWWWFRPVSNMADRLAQAGQIDAQMSRMVESELWWVPVLIGCVYGAYCLVFELLASSTPGKILLACRVAAADGSPPVARQIVVRNIVRAVEITSGLMLLVTLFLMIAGTPRRQRIGDLLAGTIVVAGDPHAFPVKQSGGTPPEDET